ncbi:VCBS domain-containing protein, partial [Zwartia sp.]|uniref:VCBS domain-containing protein n=1 Tax=Zwartia sp. TaxID=2978004 RepID=UPI0027208F04
MAKSNFPWKKKVKPSLLALEPRMLFDGAAAATPPDSAPLPAPIPEALPIAQADVTATETTSESVSGMLNVDPVVQSTTQIEPVQDSTKVIEAQADETEVAEDSLLADTHETLTVQPAGLINIDQEADQKLSFAALKVETSLMELLNADNWADQLYALFPGDQGGMTQQWLEAAESFKQGVIEGGLSINVQLRASGEILGVNGAYAENGLDGTPLIFLNRDKLDANDQQYATSVLMEEVGHWIDHQINGKVDTQGDEGERFAAYLQGLQLSDLEAQRIATENDRIILNIDGQEVEVEMASLLFSGQSYYVATNVGLEANVLVLGDPLPGTRTVFVSVPENDPYYTGNNVRGNIHVVDANNKITASFYGEISRLLKVGSTAVGLQFYVYPTGTTTTNVLSQTLLIDVYGTDSTVLATGQTQKTSSDPVAAALNAMLPANQPPVANADAGIAVEAGGSLNGTLGSNATGNMLSNDTDSNVTYVVDLVTMELKTVYDKLSFTTIKNNSTGSTATPVAGSTSALSPSSVGGLYGTLKVGADGSYSYEVNNNNAAVQALRLTSNTLSETFTYTVTDSKGGYSTSTLTITITGQNDNPIAKDDFNFAKESPYTTSPVPYSSSDLIGSIATGNVLENDSDVDSNGETEKVLGVFGSATAGSIQTIPPSITLTFSGQSGFTAVSTSSGLYYALSSTINAQTVYGAVVDSNYALIKVQSKIEISASEYDIKLTGDPAYYYNGSTYVSITASDLGGDNVGFKSDTSTTTTSANSLKAAVVSSVESVGSTVVTILDASTISGTIAIGMTVSGTGVPVGTSVQDVTYNSTTGKVATVILSTDLTTIVPGTVLSFVATAGASIEGRYGTLKLNENGTYEYVPIANNPELAAGQTGVDAFDYRMVDASGA